MTSGRTLLLALAVAAAGCTAPSTGRQATTSPSPQRTAGVAAKAGAAELPCRESIDEDAELPDSYTAVLDAVALPSADSAEHALQTVETEDGYWAKTGLIVRADTGFTIELNEPTDTASIGWGNASAQFGPAVTSTGCTGEGWLAFAGGFVVDEPKCVSLTVSTKAAEETIQVGVGAACDGQQLPVEA